MNTIRLNFRWLLPFWIWLITLSVLPGETRFAYDGHAHPNLGYDRSRESAMGYDAVLEYAPEGTKNGMTENRVLFARFAEFLAAKTTGLETRGLRTLPGTRQIPNGIPDGWRIRPTKGEGGTWYYDPANKGNAVRVMQGDPSSPFPNSQAPYVRWQRNGQALDINGNVVPKNTPDAHIPLQDFNFNPDLFR